VQASTEDVSDINPANNSAVDEDIIRFIVFRDGFESASRGQLEAWLPQGQACTRLRLDAAALAGGEDALRSGLSSLLLGQADSDRISVDLLSADGQRWLRLEAPGTQRSWLAWPLRFAELELGPGALLLRSDAGRREASLGGRSGWRWWLAPELIPAVSSSDCKGAASALGGVQ
jgi:hypothetical protein